MTQARTIAVDARPLVYPANGNARYLHSLLKELLRLRPAYRWLLYSHKPLHEDYADITGAAQVSCRIFGRKIPGPLWLHAYLPSALNKSRPALFWGTLAMLPVAWKWRSTVPAIVSVHDLNAFVAADTMPFWKRLQHRLFTGDTLRSAAKVLCLSQATQSDILRFFPHIDKGSLAVLYPGCELSSVKQVCPPTFGQATRAMAKGFFLAVGTLEPRKNLSTLIEAYTCAAGMGNIPPLVIAGRRGWGKSTVYETLRSGQTLSLGVHFIENPSDAELRWLYAHCLCLASPSVHEGFGLPLIEALQLGKALLLSDIPIYREIAPDAFFAHPQAPAQWTERLLEIARLHGKKKLKAPTFRPKDWRWANRADEWLQIIDVALGRR